jgi:hypothetical protein
MRRGSSGLWSVLAWTLLVGVSTPAYAASFDHLKCYNARDRLASQRYDVQISTDDFGGDHCQLTRPILFCTAAEQTSVVPPPPGGGPTGTPAGDFVCYRSRCRSTAEALVEDQFGTRYIRLKPASLVCAPATLESSTTSVTTTSSTSSTTVTVTTTTTTTLPTLVSIEVRPANPSVPAGRTQQFTATGMFSDGTTQDLTESATWASSDPSVATISNAAGSRGLATGVAVGTTEISAQSGAVIGTTTLTVTDATLVSIEVTPTNPSVPAGRTQQFTATGTFSDGTTLELTESATCATSDPTVPTISNADGSKGLATGVAVGMTEISAESGGVVGTTTLTVTSP